MIVVPPLVGHIQPTVALGQALLARGHDVVWVGYPTRLEGRVPPGGRLHALQHGMDDAALAAVKARGLGLRGAAAFKFLWEDLFFPLSRAMLDGVAEAVAAEQPDVIVHDQQAFAGALVARRAGIPLVTNAATSAQLSDPFDSLPQFRTWLQDGMASLAEAAGLPADPSQVASDTAILAWSTRALVGDAALPPQTVLVGPARGPRADAPPFAWDRLDDRPLVFVSLGTVSIDIGARFFEAAATVFAERPHLQGVLVAPPEAVQAPDNLLVASYVPQLDLLARSTAAVCHGGHNTVVEALSEGLPLVVAPVRDDQPVVAAQVEAAGAGVRVRFGRIRAQTLGAALDRVLQDGAFRAAAGRVRDSFAAAGGPAQAADVVERVMRERSTPPRP